MGYNNLAALLWRLRLLRKSLTKCFRSVITAPQPPKQCGKIVVAHRRMRQQANDFPETGLGLRRTTELRSYEPSKVVQRGIVRFTGQCGIYFCERRVRLSGLQ